MISQLKIKNFRLLQDITIDIEPGKPVVLIGPNSSGKSTVLEVLDLLSYAVSHGLRDAVYQKREGLQDIRTAGCGEPIEIELVLEPKEGWGTEEDKGPIRYKLSFTERHDQLLIEHESIQIYKQGRDKKPLSVLERKYSAAKTLNVQTKAHDEVPIDSDQLAIRAIRHKSFYPTLGHVREVLEFTTVYTRFLTAPVWSRAAQELELSPRTSQVIAPTPRISKRGLDLVTALYHLQAHSHDSVWWQLEKHFKQEFPFVKRLFFPAESGGKIALAWEDKRFPEVTLHAGQMSEGMISFLCLLTAILAQAQAAALGFDEPDSQIHPSAMRRLVSLFELRAESTAVFIATHSNLLLDFLQDPSASVVICRPSSEGTELHRVDPVAFAAWREDYSLSELRRQGQLDPSNHDLQVPE